MKKTTLIALLFPLCAATAQTTDDFVPQEMEWGTLIVAPHTTNYPYKGVEHLKVIDDKGVVFAYTTKANVNSVIENDYFISSNAYQSAIAGEEDVFIGKLNSSGQLEWGTYFGGVEEDRVVDVGLDSEGNIYVLGYTFSATGIATSGANKESFTGYSMPPLVVDLPDLGLIEVSPAKPVSDGFLAKFDSTGNLLWSTYIGGDRGAKCRYLYISDSNVFVIGSTLSVDNFTSSNVFQENWPQNISSASTNNQKSVPYLAKYSLEGDLIWRTYTNGLGSRSVLDANNNMRFVPHRYQYIDTDWTDAESNNLVIIDGDNAQLISSETLPNVLESKIMNFQMDGMFNHYFLLETEGEGLGTSGAFREDKVSPGPTVQHVFLVYNSAMQLQYATYLPNMGDVFNRKGEIYPTINGVVIGSITTEDGLGTADVFQSNKVGNRNAYLLKLNNNGTLEWFTYIGNSTSEELVASGNFEDEAYVSLASMNADNLVNENGLLSDFNLVEPATSNYHAHLIKLVKSNISSTEDFLKEKINVYPNPAKDILNIDLSDELLSNQLSYALYDLLGKQIANGSLAVSQNHPINVSNLATGVYLLKITDQNTQVSQQFKIIKE